MTQCQGGVMVDVRMIDTSNLNECEKEDLFRHGLATYIGEPCPFCDKAYTSAEEMIERHSVWCPNKNGRIAHKDCWDKATELERESVLIKTQ